MKNCFTNTRLLFALLAVASVAAIVYGTYLGVVLGMTDVTPAALLAALGLLLWADAWGEFLALCLRLRKGESAFTTATGRTLRVIGWCLAALTAIVVVTALLSVMQITGGELPVSVQHQQLIPTYLRAGLLVIVFATAAVAAGILHGLLMHAISLEEEQEGVI